MSHMTIHLFTGGMKLLRQLPNSWNCHQACVCQKPRVHKVCACIHIFMCRAVLLQRRGWGNRSLHHIINVTQVFLESTSHNCTWQSCAPATPSAEPLERKRTESPPRIPWNTLLKHQACFFFSPVIFYTHDGMQKRIYEVYIYGTVEYICMVECTSCSPSLVVLLWRKVEMKWITNVKMMEAEREKEGLFWTCKSNIWLLLLGEGTYAYFKWIVYICSKGKLCIIVHMKDNMYVYTQVCICESMIQCRQFEFPLLDCVCILSDKQHVTLNSWHSLGWMGPVCIFHERSTE